MNYGALLCPPRSVIISSIPSLLSIFVLAVYVVNQLTPKQSIINHACAVHMLLSVVHCLIFVSTINGKHTLIQSIIIKFARKSHQKLLLVRECTIKKCAFMRSISLHNG